MPDAAAQTRIVSVTGIRLDSRESERPFKGIFCDDISEFESYMPSQAVQFPAVLTAEPPTRPRIGSPRSRSTAPILRCRISLRRAPVRISTLPHAGHLSGFGGGVWWSSRLLSQMGPKFQHEVPSPGDCVSP
jgi:hypothetical protein